MEDWTAHGGTVETDRAPRRAAPPEPSGRHGRTRDGLGRAIDVIEGWSTRRLIGIWALLIACCSVAYWLEGFFEGQGLKTAAGPVGHDWRGYLDALYFSVVTATSVGYGDVVPMGFSRVLAVLEAAAELLVFGALVSKFVSRRQERLVEEIHRLTFEGRFERLQTNMHILLSDLQGISELCDDPGASRQRVSSRLESATAVFVGELRAVHDLLYRPQSTPEEPVLASILTGLAGVLAELNQLLSCRPEDGQTSPQLRGQLQTVARLANEICGECVPRDYAPALKDLMNRVQDLARPLAA